MNVRTAWICCLLAGTVIFHGEGIQWLGLYRHPRAKAKQPEPRRPVPPFTHEECMWARDRHGLKKRQYRFCKNDKLGHSMQAVVQAARLALYHCLKTFSDRRWNCSSALHLPTIRPDLERGTREQAFLYAFASAAMVFSIARGCAKSNIYYCNCDYVPDNDTLPNSTYRWKDCHDNVEMAEKYVIDFLGIRTPKSQKRKRLREYDSYDRMEPEDLYNRPPAGRTRRHQKRKRRRKKIRKNRSVIKMMNNHNYLAGINIMRGQRKLICICIGVSGSCAMKACKLAVRQIDDQKFVRTMRDKYLKAIWVKKEDRQLVPVSRSQRQTILPTDLVFVKHSPDYCLPDKEVGSFGTKGRKCNSTLSGSLNCENMCCGRGYSIFRKLVPGSCDCNFNTATFRIVCRKCMVTRTLNFCN